MPGELDRKLGRAALLVGQRRIEAALEEPFVVRPRDVERGHFGHHPVLEHVAKQLGAAQGMEVPEVDRGVVSRLRHAPAIVLERHPVARAPAVVAVAKAIEFNGAVADADGAFHAAALLDPVVGTVQRTAFDIGAVGIGRVIAFEHKVEGRLRTIPFHLGAAPLEVLLHREPVDPPVGKVHVVGDRAVGQSGLNGFGTHPGSEDCDRRAGLASGIDPGVSEERDPVLGQVDDDRDRFAVEWPRWIELVAAIVPGID